MIYCICCEKYPTDEKIIPSGSTFPIDEYKVKLIASQTPSTLPTDGSDVENLADGTKFAVGSLLYVVEGEDTTSEVYVFIDGAFEAWTSSIAIW